LIKQLMGILLIEISAERGFEFNVGIMRDPALRQGLRDTADEAANIIDQIRQDKASHVAYVQLFVSELRSYTFRTTDGSLTRGAEFLDPLWEKAVRWNAVDVPRSQRLMQLTLIEGCISEHRKESGRGAASLLARFNALGHSRREAA
jgi:hypothetical protein